MDIQVGDLVKLSPSGSQGTLRAVGHIIQEGRCKPPPWVVVEVVEGWGNVEVDFWLSNPEGRRGNWAYLPKADLIIVDSQMELF